MARIDMKVGKAKLSDTPIDANTVIPSGHRKVAVGSAAPGQVNLKKVPPAKVKNFHGRPINLQDIKDTLFDATDTYPWVGRMNSEDGMVEITPEDEEVHLIVFGLYGTPMLLQDPPPPPIPLNELPEDDPNYDPNWVYVPNEELEVRCGEIILQPGQSFTVPISHLYDKTVVIVKG